MQLQMNWNATRRGVGVKEEDLREECRGWVTVTSDCGDGKEGRRNECRESRERVGRETSLRERKNDRTGRSSFWLLVQGGLTWVLGPTGHCAVLDLLDAS